jgi:hypothetical protein
VDRCRIC